MKWPMKFEEAIALALNGTHVRRACWANVPTYTQATPPMQFYKTWRVFASGVSLVNGWGGSIGGAPDGDPIRNGMLYSASDADRIADDWEVVKP